MRKLIFLLSFVWAVGNAQTLVNVYNFPYYNPYNYFWGVCRVGNNMFIGTDFDSSPSYPFAMVYKLSMDGVILDSITTPFKFNHGLAWDGTNFWVAEDYRTAGARVFKMSPSGVKLDSIQIPSLIGGASGGVGDIEISNGFMWFTVYYPDFTSYPYSYAYKMDLSTRAVVDTIPLRGRQVYGITVKGDTVFYVADNFQGDVERIYAYRKAAGDTLFSFPLPDPDGDNNPKGMHWDGANLWLIADRVGGAAYAYKALYKYELSSGGTPVLTTASSIAFNDVIIGSPVSLNLIATNNGTGNLRIDSIRSNNQYFTYQPTNTPHILTPGQAKTYSVTFSPTTTGVQNGILRIYSNDLTNPVKQVALSGRGVWGAGFLVISPDTLAWGQRRVNSSSSIEVTLTNTGSGQIRVDSMKFGSRNFKLINQAFPILIDSVRSKTFRAWFSPTALNAYRDSLLLYSNASNGTVRRIGLSGTGVPFDSVLGHIIWQGVIPNNPNTSYNDLSARNIKRIGDLNGDGVNDLIVTTDNYYVIAYNGNSSVTSDVMWTFNLAQSNYNTGNVERMQCLQIATDLNNDGYNDVVVGNAGGGESVIAISGKIGLKLWEFGDSLNYDQGDIMGVDVTRDWNGDGVADVLATASGNENNLNGRFSTYCLNGLNGAVLWQINQASTYMMKYGVVATDDGGAFGTRPAGVTPGKVQGFDRSGNLTWTFNTASAPWALAAIPDIGGNPGPDVIAGDTYGNVTALDSKTGAVLWTRSIGNAFIEDVFIVDDVNGSGKKDILVSALVSPVYLLEGGTGAIIWSSNTGGTVLGAGQLFDFTGDGIPEMGAANLSDYARVYNGVTGTEVFNYANGSGSNDLAVECIWGMSDVDGNGTGEFVIGTREGKVIAFSGGFASNLPPSISVTAPNGGENMLTGSQFNIQWTAVNASPVNIDYTTNNGTTWRNIAASVSMTNYLWTVPNTPTTQAKVRVSKSADPTVFDVSDNVFTIALPPPPITWQHTIMVANNLSASQNLKFGTSPQATNGIDTLLGEYTLPAPPPSNQFDARMELPTTPAVYSLTDFRCDTAYAIRWTIIYQAGGDLGYPITMTWNPAALPPGTFYLNDAATGGYVFHINMKTQSYLVNISDFYTTFYIEYTKGICKDVAMNAGWNIVSVPVTANNMSVLSLFPQANSNAYGYNNGYQVQDTLRLGAGYWLRYPSAAVVSICGLATSGTTVPLSAGWNIVGPFDKNVTVAGITTTPAGIINSSFFAYNNTYLTVSTLEFGKGYWVRAATAGVMNLPSSEVEKTAENVSIIKDNWTRITISDATSHSTTLYTAPAGESAQALSGQFDLPPVPPNGIFDARFTTQRTVENVLSNSQSISISSAEYPVKISAEGSQLRIKDKATGGKIIDKILANGETFSITNSSVNLLEISSVEAPVNYALYQNYPNPFNPVTTIRYALPEKANIAITIYDQLGQRVSTLVNEEKDAGYYSFEWNASSLPSGVYLCEMRTNNFSAVKKVILMK